MHNPTFVKRALDLSIYAVTNSEIGGGTTNPGDNGGPGGGFGAVSCTTPYVYWAEIAAHAPGRQREPVAHRHGGAQPGRLHRAT